MTLEEWYQKGLNPDEYIESMETHKENLLHVFDNFHAPDDEEFFNLLKQKNLRVIVLTEDWCGDAMMNIPILLHITQKTDMKVRLLLRDSNLELMDNYLTNGKSRSIPIFIFINESGEEVGKWGPRAPKVQQYIDDAFSKLPEKDSEDFKEKRNEVITFLTKTYKENRDFWDEVYQSLKETLNRI